MKQEDKELLIKDLCTRLPYGVKVALYNEDIYDVNAVSTNGFVSLATTGIGYDIECIKPYLFPMELMTDEQQKEYYNTTYSNHIPTIDSFDWLNAHHFDYRGLIDKGLAIDATNLNVY